jgi:hypothetical protein
VRLCSFTTLDIVSLACLTGIVPWAFRESGAAELRHATELRRSADGSTGETPSARDLYREAIVAACGMMLYRDVDLALTEKKLGAHDASVALLDLAAIRNEHRVEALRHWRNTTSTRKIRDGARVHRDCVTTRPERRAGQTPRPAVEEKGANPVAARMTVIFGGYTGKRVAARLEGARRRGPDRAT